MAVPRPRFGRKVHEIRPEPIAGMDFNPAAALRLESDVLDHDRRGGRSRGAADPQGSVSPARLGRTHCEHESEDAKRKRPLSIARRYSWQFLDAEHSMLS